MLLGDEPHHQPAVEGPNPRIHRFVRSRGGWSLRDASRPEVDIRRCFSKGERRPDPGPAERNHQTRGAYRCANGGTCPPALSAHSTTPSIRSCQARPHRPHHHVRRLPSQECP
jgi:hypothetical protein